MKPDEIEKILDNKKAFQVEFGRKGTDLTYQQKDKMEKRKLPGITLQHLQQVLFHFYHRFFLAQVVLVVERDISDWLS